MINKVILLGNLGRDPEIRIVGDGIKVAQFSVATSENYKDKQGNWQSKTDWHNITCWRNLAERAENALKKGSLVYLEGKLSPRKYQDKEGNDRYTVDIVANLIRVLDKRDNSQSGATQQQTDSMPEKNQNSNNETDSDDLPF